MKLWLKCRLKGDKNIDKATVVEVQLDEVAITVGTGLCSTLIPLVVVGIAMVVDVYFSVPTMDKMVTVNTVNIVGRCDVR